MSTSQQRQTGIPNEGLTPTEQLERLASEKLEVFSSSIRSDGSYKDPIYQSAQSTALQIASDYGRRFLIELIQNAYDAHPSGTRDGEITIKYNPDEGQHGVLYVANRGKGFKWSNVEALSNIGLSDKPAGQSVGNKGLGFRSVLYITDDPQIFSSIDHPKVSGFDGYCFRFARPEDLETRLTNSDHLALAIRDLPPFHIPAPLIDIPRGIETFALNNYATVVRLPLRDSGVRSTVEDEISELQTDNVPLLLFLPRMRALNVVVEGNDELSFSLLRERKTLPQSGCSNNKDQLSLVDLKASGRFFVAKHYVQENQVKNAIKESIERKDLHPSWSEWSGDGEIALAVRIDDGVVHPRLYTFLPMGEQAVAPFYGYLHGAFYPKADRRSLHADIPLNALHLEEAVQLAARIIVEIKAIYDVTEFPMSWAEVGKAIIDLVCWKDVPSIASEEKKSFESRLGQAFEEIEIDLTRDCLLPAHTKTDSSGWAPPVSVRRWSDNKLKVFTAKNLVEHGDIPILPAFLGEKRLDRLDTFFGVIEEEFSSQPSSGELARAAELIAREYKSSNMSLDSWFSYYKELCVVAKNKSEAFKSAKILLCQDGHLRQAIESQSPVQKDEPEKRGQVKEGDGSSEADYTMAVFTPPKRLVKELETDESAAQLLEIPTELAQGFAFLSNHLDWFGKLDSERRFLEQSDLSRPYDGDEIVRQVSRVVGDDRRQQTRRAALIWVFKLYIAAKSGRPFSLAGARLFVPTIEGKWIQAKDSYFSAGWARDTVGDVLDKFLELGAAYSSDLREIRKKRLAATDSEIFAGKNANDWVEFLSMLGVQRGLSPIRKDKVNFRISGYELTAKTICKRLGIEDQTLAVWSDDIKEYGEEQIYQSSTHQLDGHIWYLPGQEEYDDYSDSAKHLFAEIILNWLRTAEDRYFTVILFTTSARYASRFGWSTPVGAFLRQKNWLPVEYRSETGVEEEFKPPRMTWLPDALESDRLPPYLPQVARKVNSILGREPLLVKRLSDWCGANILNAEPSLGYQVQYLGYLYATKGIERYYLKSFLNMYFGAWRRLAAVGMPLTLSPVWESYLITSYRGGYTALKLVEAQQSGVSDDDVLSDIEKDVEIQVYMRDGESELELTLLESLGEYVFNAGAQRANKIASLVKKFPGAKFIPVSDIHVEIFIDGQTLSSHEKLFERYLADECPWLATLVSLSMESMTGVAAQRLPADRTEVIDKLQKIGVRLAKEVEFEINGARIRLPEENYGCLVAGGEESPVLVLESKSDFLRWSDLIVSTGNLCRLLGHSDLAPALQLCFRTLERLAEQVPGPISPGARMAELCSELRVSERDAKAAVEAVINNVRHAAHLLMPVIHTISGEKSVKTLEQAVTSMTSIVELYPIVELELKGTPYAVEKVMECCRVASNYRDIRELLELPFARFNESLVLLGEEPVTYPDVHADAVASFLAENKDQIMDCLRAVNSRYFEERKLLTEYIKCRKELSGLTPDDNWLLQYEMPDVATVKALVNRWLRDNSAKAIGECGAQYPSWAQVRKDNNMMAKRFVQGKGRIIRAWCVRYSANSLPKEWKDPATAAQNVADRLDEHGQLDFKLLDEGELIRRLDDIDLWPAGMPHSTDPVQVSLELDDLTEEKERERRQKAAKEKQDRSVEFNGRLIDPLEVDFGALAEEVAESLPKVLKKAKLLHLTSLAQDDGVRGGTRHGGSQGGRMPSNINPERAKFIGYLGECAIYNWLRNQLPRQDISDAWKSTYRERLFPGKGDDSLGYDYFVRYRKQNWYLEVKSSTGDPQQFELGESEVRFASHCVHQRGCEYRILYVSNVENMKHTRIDILPNPLTPEGERALRNIGKGLRYRFRRSV